MVYIQQTEDQPTIRISFSVHPESIKRDAGMGTAETPYRPCLWIQGQNGANIVMDAKNALILRDFLFSQDTREALQQLAEQ